MTDQTLIAAVAEAVVERIDPRIERMERAILGDGTIGHVGLVERVRDLERSAATQHDTHLTMEDRARAGDLALHDRVVKLERKLDRFLWVAAGIGLSGGAGGAWLSQMLS